MPSRSSPMANLEFFRTIFADSPVGMAVYDPSGQCVTANRAICEIIGATMEMALAQNYREIRSWQESGLVNVALEAVKSGAATSKKVTLVSTFGKLLTANANFVPFESEGVRYLLLTFGDRSELLRAEEALKNSERVREQAVKALRKSEQRLAQVVDRMPVLLSAFNEDVQVLVWNKECERVTGYTKDEAIGDTDILSRMYPDDRYRDRVIAAIQKREGDFKGLEFTLVAKDGTEKIISWSDIAEEVPIPGWATWAVGTEVTDRVLAERSLRDAREQLEVRVQDRTRELEEAKIRLERDIEARQRAEQEKELLEKQLQQSRIFEAVGRLAGGVAHDFNNLLGSVLGCLYAIRQEAAAGVDVLEELGRAERLCKQGGDLTRQLLTVARRRPGQYEVVAPELLLNEAGILVRRLLPKAIDLNIESDAGLPNVEVDRSLITNALLNLSLNARDAMPGGGSLAFRARAASPEESAPGVVIEVSDTGVGIPAELHERIFEPFFSTKGPSRGHGLGLSTLYSTIAESGGTVCVESSPGAGTTFRMCLPVVGVGAPTESAPLAGAPARHPLTSQEVLIVEDEPDVARMERDALQRKGYALTQVSDGMSAMEVLRDRPDEIGLVVLDLVLPGVGGDKVNYLLEAFCPEIPVLLTTGREDLAHAVKPARPLLVKPFTDAEFLQAIERALGPGIARDRPGSRLRLDTQG